MQMCGTSSELLAHGPVTEVGVPDLHMPNPALTICSRTAVFPIMVNYSSNSTIGEIISFENPRDDESKAVTHYY